MTRWLQWTIALTAAAALAGFGGGPEPDMPEATEAMPEPSQDLPEANADCDPADDMAFVCGVDNPEDLIAIPDTDLVVVSGYTGGPIHYVSRRDQSRLRVFPVDNPSERHDTALYPDCPGPIDPNENELFSAHGLNLITVDDGLHHLYVVHHGFRESVEIFEIDARAQGGGAAPAVPGLTWIGCVVAPEGMTLNSVSPLPHGGWVATVPFVPPEGGEFSPADIGSAAIFGVVLEWHPEDGWSTVPESESSGPNGIEASPDGEWLYVNLWSAGQVMRLSRGREPVEKQTVDLGFFPDNIRWQADGSLLSAGHSADGIPRILECLETLCDDMRTHTARVDPDTLAIEHVVDVPVNEHFFTGTAALDVGDEIWMGSVRGERIARFPGD